MPTIRTADLGLVLYEPYSENYRYALPNGFFQLVAAGLPIVRGQLQEIEAAIGGHGDWLLPAAIRAGWTRAGNISLA